MSARELILASTSPYRRALLERLDIPFRCVAPEIDEEAAPYRGLPPDELAIALARAKAAAVASREPDAIVVGSDQVCALDDESLGKPGTVERAVERLTRLAGREHCLITAVCVQRGHERRELVDVTTLRMRALSRADIERYVAVDEPLDCAGAYKIEEHGIALFDSIQSRDHTAIVGLPLLELRRVLQDLGAG